MQVRSETLAMIERFIAFDTTSRTSNRLLIDFVLHHLGGLGIESRLTGEPGGGKANLFATIGPADRPGIVLSGHTDTVPVDGQSWSSDPFRLALRGERLHGRGVVDMKGFLAIALAAVPRMRETPLTVPVHLALSYDEEVGCLGVPHLLDDLRGRATRPLACIVGEPTGLEVVRAHKGKVGCRVTVTGQDAHSAVPQLGANAIMAAGELIAELARASRRLRDDGPYDPGFDPPYATLQVCEVAGGIAINVVPALCTFSFELRYLPGQDPHALLDEVQHIARTVILPELRRGSPDAEIGFELLPGCLALDTGEHESVTAFAMDLAGVPTSRKVGFGTEAGYFQHAGIPTIVCGPGSIDQAHKPDEFLELDQVAGCEAFLDRLIAACASGEAGRVLV